MKKILCPVDISAAANNAIVYAAKLAKKLDASLELFNVQLLAELTPVQALMGEASNLDSATRQLEDKALEVREVFKINCEARVTTGLLSLASRIKEEASAFDLIVMGTAGEPDMDKKFFGSNAYQVIRDSAIPMMMVPSGCGYSDITSIVYAFDYWHEYETPMASIVELVKALQCKLCVLQVMQQHFSREAELKMEETQRQIDRLYGNEIPISFDTLYAPQPASGMDGFMIAGNADVLAICSRNSNLITTLFDQSVTHTIARKASYPVYIFHR
jgi:nucleotide-binding universal stress UspA family protein